MPRDVLIKIRRGTRTEWLNTNPILDDGELGFETDTGKLKIGNNTSAWNILDYIGSQENYIKVKNSSGYAIQRGQAVYVSGFDSVNKVPSVSLYIADGSISEQLFIGLISEYTADGDYGFINNFGPLSNINASGSTSNISVGNETWSNGDVLYVSSTDYGKLTKYKPDKNIILVGLVTSSSNSTGSILVRSFINPKLSQLNEIGFSNLVSDNILKYNSSASQWSNSNELDGGII
jgi:hypothetical protein